MSPHLLQHRDYLLTGYGREPFEKVRDRISTFEVIQEGLDGNARASKDRSSTHDLRIGQDFGIAHNGSIDRHADKTKKSDGNK